VSPCEFRTGGLSPSLRLLTVAMVIGDVLLPVLGATCLGRRGDPRGLLVKLVLVVAEFLCECVG